MVRSSAIVVVGFLSLLGWHPRAEQLPASRPFSRVSIARAMQEADAVVPVAVHREFPFYPADAMRHKTQGTVVVECEVKTDGTVGNVRVVRSVDKTYGLDDAVVTAAKRWRFKPVIKDGKSVPATVTIEMAFNLGDSIVKSKRD